MASADGPAPAPKRITVLISGSGSNLQALIDASTAAAGGALAGVGRITHVVSDRKDAYGLQRARAVGIATSHLGILPYKKRFPDEEKEGSAFAAARRAYDADLAALVLRGASDARDEVGAEGAIPDLVVCAGFMRILTPSFLEPLRARGVPIINLHPSLHGDLVGAHCIERAWEEFQAGTRAATGVMVHYVIAEVDMGAPIVQREVPMAGCESVQDLQERMHQTEHVLIVEGARAVLQPAAE